MIYKKLHIINYSKLVIEEKQHFNIFFGHLFNILIALAHLIFYHIKLI